MSSGAVAFVNKYRFTKRWFFGSEIKKHLLHYCDTTAENHILEIGCYEGLSSVFFANNLLNHSNSSLTCVDPFMTIDNNDHRSSLEGKEEENFDYNIAVCDNSSKITVHKITSDEFFEIHKPKAQTFNIIYIDGCHIPDYIGRDMENSFQTLKSNGIMWMDDYKANKDTIQLMNNFIDKNKDEIEIIHKGYQLALRKK